MNYVEDGPNKYYSKSNIKIIHLLKQPTKNTGKSLPKLIEEIVKDKLGRKFMYYLATRTYGLLNKFASWEETISKSDQVLGESLLKSGIINIEKKETVSTSNSAKVDKWAKDNKKCWHGQILKHKPDLVICGKTFNAVIKALNISKSKIQTAPTGMRYFVDPDIDKQIIYLDTFHPTAWKPPREKVHNDLMASAEIILNLINKR